MVVVLREYGLRFTIYVDDHEPAHVHVIKSDGSEAKFVTAGVDGASEMAWNRGLSKGELRKARIAIRRRRALLLAGWDDIHG